MDESTWDPERLRIVGSVLSRYSAHLAPGHRIRLGMEGDPCSTYRSADDAPRATVVDVRREPNGEVHFRAQIDGSDGMLELDNLTVAPGRLWEIDPDYLEEFRGYVQAQRSSPTGSLAGSLDDSLAEVEDADGEAQENPSRGMDDEPRAHTPPPSAEEEQQPRYAGANDELEYRSSIDTHFDRLERQMEDIDATNRTFRETMASTVRALAGDLMRAAQGTPIEFAHQYADRYDLAIAERVSDPPLADDYRGEGKSRSKDRYQGEKTEFLGASNFEEDDVSRLTE